MKSIPTAIPGVLVFEPDVHEDARGFFMETFRDDDFRGATGCARPFVQDNHSRSAAGVLRGLHFQVSQAQGKLVRVVAGEVFDVAVDLRRGSPTFGRWVGERLSAANRRQMWIPEGFAHGFLVLAGPADTLYKATDYYAPQHERTLAWDDPAVGIAWPLSAPPVLTDKDRRGLPPLRLRGVTQTPHHASRSSSGAGPLGARLQLGARTSGGLDGCAKQEYL